MKSMFTMSLALGLLALAQAAPQAATLQVKHNPGSGQYASIKDAMKAANDNDVIEVIDNSAPFNESIAVIASDASTASLKSSVTKITIRGKADLNPRPTVVADGTKEWSQWDPGVNSIIYGNIPYTLENLILDSAGKTNLPIDNRFAAGCVYNNVKFVLSGAMIFLCANQTASMTMNDCEIIGGNTFWQLVGTLTLNRCRFTGQNSAAVDVKGGTANVTDCWFQPDINAGVGLHVFNDWSNGNDVVLNATNCVFYHPGKPGMNMIHITEGNPKNTGAVKAHFDNCDVIGGTDPAAKTDSGIIVTDSFTELTVKDTIFYNWGAAGIAMIGGAETMSQNLVEDYNAYKECPLVFGNIQWTAGPHDIALAAADSLYIDPVGGNFKIFNNSPAATLNSTGAPAYAGSQGIGQGTAPTYGWPLQAVKVSTAPTIDGVINASEWSKAVPLDLRLSTLTAKDKYFANTTHNGTNLARVIADDADCSGLIYLTWDAQNLYVAVDAKDNDIEPKDNEGSAGNVNRGDCFQICLDYDQTKATDGQVGGTKVYIPSWSITTNSATQTAANNNTHFYQFWPTDDTPNPMTGTQWNLKTNATGYIFEAKIPWTAFIAGGDSYTKPFPPAEGQTAGMLPMLEDNDMINGTLSTGFLYPAGSGGNIIANASAYNTVTFTSNPVTGVNAAHTWEVFE